MSSEEIRTRVGIGHAAGKHRAEQVSQTYRAPWSLCTESRAILDKIDKKAIADEESGNQAGLTGFKIKCYSCQI